MPQKFRENNGFYTYLCINEKYKYTLSFLLISILFFDLDIMNERIYKRI